MIADDDDSDDGLLQDNVNALANENQLQPNSAAAASAL